jgi:UDPglucose 6-dehydrogenase
LEWVVDDKSNRAILRKVANAVGGNLRGKTVAVLCLNFKPDSDDVRAGPSIPLVTGLLDMGARVRLRSCRPGTGAQGTARY